MAEHLEVHYEGDEPFRIDLVLHGLAPLPDNLRDDMQKLLEESAHLAVRTFALALLMRTHMGEEAAVAWIGFARKKLYQALLDAMSNPEEEKGESNASAASNK